MEWKTDGSEPVYIQLARCVRTAIASGSLKPGERLMPVRDLAASASVNPNTMQRAMSLLEEEGLVAAERTAGRAVTSDGEKIARLAEKLAVSMALEYLRGLRSIGKEKEAFDILKEAQNG